jgi:hypothetical protein
MARNLLLINRTDNSLLGLLLTFITCSKQLESEYSKKLDSTWIRKKGWIPHKGGYRTSNNEVGVVKGQINLSS